MKFLFLAACLVMFGAGCGSVPAPTGTPAPTAAPATPVPPVTGPQTPRPWSVYTSEIKQFSLQLPADWVVQPGIPAEDILLQISGGAEGRLMMLEDFPHDGETFQAFARRYFRALLEENPEAIEYRRYEAGLAARGVTRLGDTITVNYLFQPERGTAKVLSFFWEQPTANPLWESVAERFNPHSSRLIILFSTPAPAG